MDKEQELKQTLSKAKSGLGVGTGGPGGQGPPNVYREGARCTSGLHSLLTPHNLGALRICQLESSTKGDNVPK